MRISIKQLLALVLFVAIFIRILVGISDWLRMKDLNDPRALTGCKGRKTLDGRPLEGANIRMTNSRGTFYSTSDSTGQFEVGFHQGPTWFPGVPVGTLICTISLPDSQRDSSALSSLKDETVIADDSQKVVWKINSTPQLILPIVSSQKSVEFSVQITKAFRDDLEIRLESSGHSESR